MNPFWEMPHLWKSLCANKNCIIALVLKSEPPPPKSEKSKKLLSLLTSLSIDPSESHTFFRDVAIAWCNFQKFSLFEATGIKPWALGYMTVSCAYERKRERERVCVYTRTCGCTRMCAQNRVLSCQGIFSKIGLLIPICSLTPP